MLEPKIRELLGKLRRGLKDLYGDRLEDVFLFGSYARDEATSESDLDILVVLDEVEDYGQEIEHTGEFVSGLSLDYGISISRVFASSSAWRHRDSPFLCNVRGHAIAA